MRWRDQESVSSAPNGLPQEAQPKWRQDFPVDIPHDEYISRRDFTKYMVLVSFAFTAGQFWILLQNKFRRANTRLAISKRIATMDQIANGQTVAFEYPEQHNPCILVRTAENRLLAYSQKCTHLSCPVIPDAAKNVFRCPCHEGLFDMNTGAALAGPPRRPLSKIKLEVRGNEIYAVGMETPA